MGGTQSSPSLGEWAEPFLTLDYGCLQCDLCANRHSRLEVREPVIKKPKEWVRSQTMGTKEPNPRWLFLRGLVQDGKERIVEVLLGKEAFDMDDADEEGNTLLHLAARHGNRKMCEVLLAAGSTIRRNKQGDTPVDTARQHDHQDCVFILEPATRRHSSVAAVRVVNASVQVKKQGWLALPSQHGATHWGASGWEDHYAVVHGMTMQLFHSKDEASAEGGQAARTVDLYQAKALIPPIPKNTNDSGRYAGEFCVMEYGSDAALHVACNDKHRRHEWLVFLHKIGVHVPAQDLVPPARTLNDQDENHQVKMRVVRALVTYTPKHKNLPAFPPDRHVELQFSAGEDLVLHDMRDDGFCLCRSTTTEQVDPRLARLSGRSSVTGEMARWQVGWARGSHLTSEISRFEHTGHAAPLVKDVFGDANPGVVTAWHKHHSPHEHGHNHNTSHHSH